MTLGALIEMPAHLIIVSDLLATGGGTCITPSNITIDDIQLVNRADSNSSLVRKFLTLSESRMVTFAGRACQIVELSKSFHPVLSDGTDSRLMVQEAMEVYWEFLEKYTPLGSSALQGPQFLGTVDGALFGSAKRDGGCYPDGDRYSSNLLGEFHAIGTGAKDFIALVKGFEGTLKTKPETSDQMLEQNCRLLKVVTASKLFIDEGDPKSRDTWGGMLDFRILDFVNRRTLRDPSQMYLSVTVNWDRNPTMFEIGHKVVWIDPHSADRSLSIFLRGEREATYQRLDWKICDLIKPDHTPPPQLGSSKCPNEVHIIFHHCKRDQIFESHYDLSGSDLDCFRYDFQSRPPDFTRFPSLHNLITREVRDGYLRALLGPR